MMVILLLASLAWGSDNTEQPGPVRQGVRAQISDVVRCYGKQSRQAPLSGTVTATGAVAGGHLDDVEIADDQIGNKALARCIRRRMERWRFVDTYEGPLRWTFTFGASGDASEGDRGD